MNHYFNMIFIVLAMFVWSWAAGYVHRNRYRGKIWWYLETIRAHIADEELE